MINTGKTLQWIQSNKPFRSQTCTCTTTSQDKMYMCVLSQTSSYSQATRCRPLLSRANTSNNGVYTVHSSQDHSRERLFSGNTFKDILIYICALKKSFIYLNAYRDVLACMLHGPCTGQRMTCVNWFSSSPMWSQAWTSGPQAWQQAPHPAKLRCVHIV